MNSLRTDAVTRHADSQNDLAIAEARHARKRQQSAADVCARGAGLGGSFARLRLSASGSMGSKSAAISIHRVASGRCSTGGYPGTPQKCGLWQLLPDT
jgi:hypothetical protein